MPVNSENKPVVVMTPMPPLAPCTEIQRLPPGPLTMSHGLPPVTANSVATAAGVIRTTLFLPGSVYQTLPSEPSVIPCGDVPPEGVGHSVTAPPVPIRPTLSLLVSVNQSFPSAPAMTSLGDESAVVTGKSLIVWVACATAGTASKHTSTQRQRR